MTYFVDGSAAGALAADVSFHAGTARKLLQDNLKCAGECAAYDYCAFNQGSDDIGGAPSTADEWEAFECFGFKLPVYPTEGGGWRTLTLSLEARVTGGQGQLRAYLLPRYHVPAVDATYGIPEADVYATVSVTALAYSVKTFSAMTPDETCLAALDCGGASPGVVLPATYVRFIFQLSDNTKALYIRGLRVEEGT